MKAVFKMFLRPAIISCLILPTFFSYSQFWCKSKLNQFGNDGLKTGKWITWWDEAEKIPMSVARYKEGKEVGVSKEYHQNGKLRLKFRHGKDRIRVKYYNENRKLEQKGWSILEYTKEDVHYYWQGKWKFYSVPRKIQRISIYSNGEEIQSVIK